jgi:hypothetical protein
LASCSKHQCRATCCEHIAASCIAASNARITAHRCEVHRELHCCAQPSNAQHCTAPHQLRVAAAELTHKTHGMAKLGALDFFGDGAAPAPAPAPPAPAPDNPPAAPVTSESATRTRKRLGITVEAAGAAPPPPWNNWSDGDLEERVAAALPRGGWPRPTPVQAQAAPVLLEGRDALVVAPTGGGKTGAFLVPALHLVIASRGKRKTLVAAPTRELVAQLAREARRWLGLCGSDLVVATPPFTDAKAALCVATPQALLQSKISPSLLVLDEADRLLDTEGGLLKAVDALLAKGATTRALVSATAPGPFMEAAVACLAPTRCVVRVGTESDGPRATVAQRFVYTGDDDRSKAPALRELIRDGACAPPCVTV